MYWINLHPQGLGFLTSKGWEESQGLIQGTTAPHPVLPCYGLEAYKDIFIYYVRINFAHRFQEFTVNLNRQCTVNSGMSVEEFPQTEDDS